MYEDGEFDYRSLPLADLEYAVEHVDGAKYPKNLAGARAALEARRVGTAPEPPPLLDAATNAKYTYWAQKILGTLAGAYGFVGAVLDKFVIIDRLGRPIILEGSSALVASGIAAFLGIVAVLAPRSRLVGQMIFPRVWWIYPVALVLAGAVIGEARLARGA